MRKICKTCFLDKELDQFPLAKSNSDGRMGSCRDCQNEKSRERDFRKGKTSFIRGANWTAEEDCKLKKLYNEGSSVSEFKKAFPNRSERAIQTRASQLKLAKSKVWSEDDISKLKKLCHEGLSPDEIKPFFKDRSLVSIKQTIRKNSFPNPKAHWSDKDVGLLKILFEEGDSIEEISKFVHRTERAIQKKLSRLGLTKRDEWTKEELKTVVNKAEESYTYEEISEFFLPNRTVSAIHSKMSKIGFRHPTYYTEAEDELVSKLVKEGNSYQEIADQLVGRTVSSIGHRVRRKGLFQKEDIPSGYRRCPNVSGCGELKELNEFLKNEGRYYGCCKSCRIENRKKYHLAKKEINLQRARIYSANRRSLLRKEGTKIANEFYRANSLPELKWEEGEFASEKHFQKSFAHLLSRRYGLVVEEWVYLENYGFPDIYLPQMNIFFELKLSEKIWSPEKIIEQVSRYAQIEQCILICFDEKPDWAFDHNIQWFTPSEVIRSFDKSWEKEGLSIKTT